MNIELHPIGVIHSPFKELFSIPRQSGIVPLNAVIELYPPYNREEALRGLECFSHLWAIFFFHHSLDKKSKSLSVRPPRLGGNIKQGVFATRSPFRPNPIGLSLIEILSIENGQINIRAGDFLDQTPLLDLKPYLKETESIPNAHSSWTDFHKNRPKLEVVFECPIPSNELMHAITAVLQEDPRPSFHTDQYKIYGTKIFNVDVKWEVYQAKAIVKDILYLF